MAPDPLAPELTACSQVAKAPWGNRTNRSGEGRGTMLSGTGEASQRLGVTEGDVGRTARGQLHRPLEQGAPGLRSAGKQEWMCGGNPRGVEDPVGGGCWGPGTPAGWLLPWERRLGGDVQTSGCPASGVPGRCLLRGATLGSRHWAARGRAGVPAGPARGPGTVPQTGLALPDQARDAGPTSSNLAMRARAGAAPGPARRWTWEKQSIHLCTEVPIYRVMVADVKS